MYKRQERCDSHPSSACGIRIIFATDKFDTETVDDELLLSVVQACSQAENDQHSEHIVWRLRRRAEDGTLGLYSRVVRAIRKISMVC